MTTSLTPSERPLGDALARLEARWGSAAIRLGNGSRVERLAGRDVPVEGALARALEPLPTPSPHPLQPLSDEPVSTGFPELDAVLGIGGLPRQGSATIRGATSSGKTTLALRCLAEAQGRGAIGAWLDLTRAFDPLEAASRGVDLRWLVVLRPADPAEGFKLAGALLSGRAVDLLVIDLPPRVPARQEAIVRRLSAHAQRVGARLIVLEPASLGGPIHGALAELSGLRLELSRRDWIRLGRDVVGQRTEVTVAKDRFGSPGRQVELEIHYAQEIDRPIGAERHLDDTGPPALRSLAGLPTPSPWTIDDATPPSRLDPSPAPPRAGTPVGLDRPARAGRPAVGAGHGPRLQPGRETARRPARPAARRRP
jgi:RecA/RadA recombinase